MTGWHIGKLLQQPERSDLAEAIFCPLCCLGAERNLVHVASGICQFFGGCRNVSCPEFHAESLWINRSTRQAGILHRHRSAGNTELNVPGHHLQKLSLVDMLQRIEITDFCREF